MTPAHPDVSIQEESFTFPLSFAQERLWFLHQLEKDSAVYNISRAFRLTGLVNVNALEASLNEIIRRHEILRTVFSTVEGQPAQVITSSQCLTLAVITLRELPPTERESQARQMATEKAQQPFDLAAGPLLRGTLWRLDEEEYVLLLTTHHIVFDDWSLGVLLGELTTFYEAFSLDSPPLLPELSIQYADFAHWQREWLHGEVLETHLSYWQEQLTDVPPLLNLPTDRPRPTIQSYQGAYQSLMLPAAVSQSLATLGVQENATLFMILLAAFKILLHRYTKQDDLVVGSPIAGRTQVELEKLIGRFTNILLLRTNLLGNPTYRELLSRVRTVALEAYAHQELPFEKLVEEWDARRTSPFQVMFQLRNTPKKTISLPGLRIEEFGLGNGVEKFDLSLEVIEKAEGLLCLFKYRTDLFEATTIKQMSEHFQNLLENIVAEPDQPLSDLLPLTETETERPQSFKTEKGHQKIRARLKTEPTFVAPRNMLEHQLGQIWERVLGIHPIGVQDNFFELGGHSLLAMRLFAQIEKETGNKPPLASLFQAPTIEELARILDGGKASKAAPTSSLVAMQTDASKPPFFCLPGNLGNALTHLGDLARNLKPDQPFYSFQDSLENPTQIETVAARYLDEIRTVQPKGPYFLGGICWGAVVAFEMAQQLQAQGQEVGLLALVEPSQLSAPGLRPYFNLVTTILRRIVQRFRHHARNVSRLDTAGQKDYARLKAKVIANKWAVIRYAPQRYLGQIELFLTRESLGIAHNPKFGWHKLIADEAKVHEIPGTHDTITGNNNTTVEETHMQALAEMLRVCIDEALTQDKTT